MENELSNRNKWGFASGCTFRDLTYVLVSLFFITFIQYTAGLNAIQFGVLNGIIIGCRVWDAFNDPMMSTIISNTKSKQGRYKPYILWGAVANSVFLVAMFLSPNALWGLSGWGYVAWLGVSYLLFGMTFTVNDVSYWSLLPHLARSKNTRDKLTGLVAIFASVGQIITGALIPFLQAGRMVTLYRYYSIICAVLFILSQLMVYLVVQDKDNSADEEPAIGIKDMFKIIGRNKQLITMLFVVLIYSLASALITVFGTNFFYCKLGYNGTYMTIVTGVFAVGSLVSQALYAKIAQKLSRATIVKYMTIILVVGYLVLFGYSNVPLSWLGGNPWIYTAIFAVISLVIFSSQGIIYLAILVMLSNTIEYDQWKNGRRNESIIFTVRSFMVKLATAFEQGLYVLIVLITGFKGITDAISDLEISYNSMVEAGSITSAAAGDAIKAGADALLLNSNPLIAFGLSIGMCLIPAILYVVQYFIVKKNYIIDEPFYEKLCNDIDNGLIPNEKFDPSVVTDPQQRLAYNENKK